MYLQPGSSTTIGFKHMLYCNEELQQHNPNKGEAILFWENFCHLKNSANTF